MSSSESTGTLKDGTEEYLPVFVYGTLMPGFRNFEAMASHFHFRDPESITFSSDTEELEPLFATISGVRLVHFPAGFPGVYRCDDMPERIVRGVILWIDRYTYTDTMNRLDDLEMVDDSEYGYTRVKTLATIVGEKTRKVTCWTYICRINENENDAEKVPSGDWSYFLQESSVTETAAQDWHKSLQRNSTKNDI